MISFHAESAQLLAKAPDQHIVTSIYDSSREQALATYYKLGALLHPWDESWRKKATEIQEQIRERRNKIGDTNISGDTVVKLIKQYEQAKHQWKKKKRNESS